VILTGSFVDLSLEIGVQVEPVFLENEIVLEMKAFVSRKFLEDIESELLRKHVS